MENAMFFNILASMDKTRNTVYKKGLVIMEMTLAKNGNMR
jgi:hypothetical protein